MADAAAQNKRPVEEGVAGAQAPPAKSIKFAADTKPAGASSVGFRLPASHAAAGASATAAAAPAVHANQKIGVPVDLDGGYRCTKTGRWIGNGTWVRPPFVHHPWSCPGRAHLRPPSRDVTALLVCRGSAQKPLWNGIDVGSWEGSYWYGIPDDQQEAYRKQEQEKAAAKRAADAAAAGAE
jgi:hypothetical protein